MDILAKVTPENLMGMSATPPPTVSRGQVILALSLLVVDVILPPQPTSSGTLPFVL